MPVPQVKSIDLGLIDYKEAWDIQERIFAETVSRKIANRGAAEIVPTENVLLFCEHPHVYTLGKSGNAAHLLLSGEQLAAHGATYYEINRGGDITYHGPGQLVMYPIFDLDHFFSDIHKYLRYLEEAVIQTLAEFGISAERYPGYTGAWLDADGARARKICAMGVKASRWVTMHGIGFNVNTDLSYFEHIVPCGIEDKAVTSMKQELGSAVDMESVKTMLRQKMAAIFEFDYL